MSDIVEALYSNASGLRFAAELVDAGSAIEASALRVSASHCDEAAGTIARLEAELAEARDKALDEAAEAVCGYIHPAYGKLPGEPFATAVIRALKSPKP